MNALHLAVVCAVVSAARAIESAGKTRRDLTATCGGWSARFEFEEDGMSVGLNPADRFEFERLVGSRTPFDILDAPLKSLTGDTCPGSVYGVPEVRSFEMSEAHVLAAIAEGGVDWNDLPEGFDWRTWEPRAVPA